MGKENEKEGVKPMTETKVYCDFCNKQLDTEEVEKRENKRVKISIYGGLTNGRVFEQTYDTCKKCLNKIENQLNITSKDYQV